VGWLKLFLLDARNGEAKQATRP